MSDVPKRRFPFRRAQPNGSRPAARRYAIAAAVTLAITTLGFGLFAAYLVVLIPFTPSKEDLIGLANQRASVVVDIHGDEIARFEHARRDWVDLKDVSPHVVDALVATEDHRFYRHNGVDLRRLVSAVVHTLFGDMQGGSTITMQLARNLYPESIGNAFGPNRKCKEIVTAKKIEAVFTKDEIIEIYLNTVPFLYNARGIELGARTYFSKSADELSLEESAVLVGMLKATTWYNPIRNPASSRERRNVVLAQMFKHSVIDEAAYRRAIGSKLVTRFKLPPRSGSRAPHFAERVERKASEWAGQHGYDLFTDGLTIHTALDLTVQEFAERAVRRQGDALQRVANVEWSTANARVRSTDIRDYAALDRSSHAFNHLWTSEPGLLDQFIRESAEFHHLVEAGTDRAEALAQVRANAGAMSAIKRTKTRLEAGFVAIDPRNGHVKAWVGSRDYVRAPYDHVASARRQPGSTFKPVVYAAALESGYSPDDLVPNQPVELRDGRSETWRLAAARDEPMYVSLREGLTASHNNVAAWLMQEIGTRKTVGMADRLGIRQSELDAVPSLALGTSPVTLLEMASVYATIAAEGVYHEPLLVTSIADSTGAVVAAYASEPLRVMSQNNAIALTDMLRDVVDRGTGQRIRHQFGIRADVGGKTGTTQNNVDGWFMMIHPHLASGAWVGFDDPRIRFRSDFWGQGAHNALFVVGDVYRQASANGALSQRARFADPPRRRGDLHFADGRSTWFGRQFDRIVGAFGHNAGQDERSAGRRVAPDSRRADRSARDDRSGRSARTRGDGDSRDRIAELADRLEEYERMKQRLEGIIENLRESGDLDDRILDAYNRERESNPEVRELERALETQVRRWLAEAEAGLSGGGR